MLDFNAARKYTHHMDSNKKRDASNARAGTVTIGRREYKVSIERDSRDRSLIILTGKRGAVYGLMMNENMMHEGSRIFFAVDGRGFGLAAALSGVWFYIDADGNVKAI